MVPFTYNKDAYPAYNGNAGSHAQYGGHFIAAILLSSNGGCNRYCVPSDRCVIRSKMIGKQLTPHEDTRTGLDFDLSLLDVQRKSKIFLKVFKNTAKKDMRNYDLSTLM